jgi:hypothetical protein
MGHCRFCKSVDAHMNNCPMKREAVEIKEKGKMDITGIIPQREVNYPTKETDLEKAVAKFYEINPDAEITSIDGREVVAMCENCGMPIFIEEQAYLHDEDGIYWHEDDCC